MGKLTIRSIFSIAVAAFLFVPLLFTGHAVGGAPKDSILQKNTEEKLRREVVKIERALGSDAQDIVVPLFQLARILWENERYDEALSFLRRCIDIAYAESSAAELIPVNQLGPLLVDIQSKYRSMHSADELQQAHKVSNMYAYYIYKVGGVNSDVYAIAIMDRASISLSLEQFSEAKKDLLDSYNMALKLRGDRRLMISEILTRLAGVAQAQADYEDAERWYRRSLELSIEASGPDDCGTLISLSNLGQFLTIVGRRDEAEAYLRQAVGASMSCGSKMDDATYVGNLATALRRKGNFGNAEQLYKKSLAIRNASLPEGHADIAHAHYDLGGIYLDLGRHLEADNQYRQALAILDRPGRPQNMDLAYTLNGHAIALSAIGQRGEAEGAYLRSLKIRETIFGSDHFLLANIYENMAVFYDDAGQPAKSLPLYEKSLRIQENKFGPTHPQLISVLTSLAVHHLDQNNNVEAGVLIRRAITLALSSPGRAENEYTFRAAALFERYTNHPNSAIFFGKLAVNEIQRLRASLTNQERVQQASFLQGKAYLYRELARWLGEAGRIDEALQVLAMLKEHEYFEFVRGDAEAGDPRTTTATLSATEVELSKQLQEASSLPPEQFYVALDRLRDTLALDPSKGTAAADSLVEQVRAKNSIKYQLSKIFDDGAVLLQYVVGRDELTIFFTSATAEFARTVPISASDVNLQVIALRHTLTDPHLDPVPAARALYSTLLAPIAADLERAKARMLVVSLDDKLRYVPLTALHDGKGWVAERYPVAMFTLAGMSNLATAPRTGWTVAGFGATKGGEGLSPLVAVEDELGGIVRNGKTQGVLPGTLALNEQFTGAAVQQAVKDRYPVLHLASHFVFKRSVESYLLLGDGGAISLRDVRHGKYVFTDVDLLALSACDTGKIGNDDNGREVESLGAAVQEKGAKSVLASLWPVADASTAVLMRRFYHLRESTPGISKAEALRQAQMWLITGQPLDAVERDAVERNIVRRGKEPGTVELGKEAQPATYAADPARPYAHPNYWAPFIIMGNWL